MDQIYLLEAGSVKEEPSSPPHFENHYFAEEIDIEDHSEIDLTVKLEKRVDVVELPLGFPSTPGLDKDAEKNRDLKFCDSCSFSTSIRRELKLHVRNCLGPLDSRGLPISKSRVRERKCKHGGCLYVTTNKFHFNNHMFKQHGDTLHLKKCAHCMFESANLTAFKNHMMNKHFGKPRPRKWKWCRLCRYITLDKFRFNNHLFRKHGNTLHLRKCAHCKFESANLKKFKIHMKKHFWRCSFEGCHYTASAIGILNNHKAKNHGETWHLFNCPHCKYSTVFQCLLKKHAIKHTIQANQCTYENCTYSSTDRALLNNHLLKTHGETLKKCPRCEYSTAILASFNTHLKTHFPSYNKKLKCSYENCSYTAKKPLLINHMAKKHGDTSNMKKCPHCKYSTSNAPYLKKHIDKHLPYDKKHFKCTYYSCNYSAAQKMLLVGHLAKIHGETANLKTCPHCKYSTAFGSNLKTHIKKHLKDKEKIITTCSVVDRTITPQTRNPGSNPSEDKLDGVK